MKSVLNSFAVLVVLLFTLPAAAQKQPLPRSANQPPVLCTGCPGTNVHGQLNDGLPTAAFSLPVAAHVGRLVDSSSTTDYQHIGFRTARAGKVRIAPTQRGTAPPRIYIGIGEAIGVYSLSTFYTTTLPGGTVPVNSIVTGSRIAGVGRNPLERIAMVDAFVYPEATMSGWDAAWEDGQQRLGDFDFDDRGLIYAAYITFGWGIVRDDGRMGGEHLPKVVQVLGTSNTVIPDIIISLKTGGRYYAVVSAMGGLRHQLYDVTNASSPSTPVTRVGTQWGIRGWAKHDDSSRVAILDYGRAVSIYDYAAFVAGGSPIARYTAPAGKVFADVSFDDAGALWFAETQENGTGENNLWRATPSGGSYTVQTFTPFGPKFAPTLIDASAGFVFAAGRGENDGSVGLEARILKIESGQPRLMDDGNFFRRYYNRSLPGQAMPQTTPQYTTWQRAVKIHKHGTKTYAFYNIHGLGDVYELQGNDSVNVTMRTHSFGTVNPFARPTQPGPFVGDRVTFNASSPNPLAQFRLFWDFGNPEAGGLSPNTDLGQDVTHQFTGLDTAAKVQAPKAVTATSTLDPDVFGRLVINLALPAARIGATARPTPLLAPAAIDVIAGDEFNDASDGSVESHFATWTIDGVPTPALPNVPVSVGPIGPHTLSFNASYGVYDPTAFTGSGLYNVGINGITYTVRPFLVSMNAPVKSGTNIVFGATGRKTSDTSILTATQWTVTWKVNGTAQPSQLVTIGTIPSLTIPQTSLGAGSTVEVQVAVDPSGLGEGATSYATHSAMTTLTPPDPEITISTCAHIGDPCVASAKSISNMSMADWTFLWTVKNSGGTTIRTGTSATLPLAFTTAGTYTVALVATRSVFDVAATTRTVTVAAPLCGPPPAQSSLSIDATCTSNCPVGTPIQFSVSTWGTSLQDCDTVSWNFGDGSAAKTGQDVSHSFASAGTFTVRVTISNTSGSPAVSTTKSITIGSGSTCTVPSNISITYSGSKGCAPGVACKQGEAVTFVARKNGAVLQTCDSASWSFGNGQTSTQKVPTITYNSPGTYNVSVTISNANGSSPATISFPVVPDATVCSGSPAAANLTISYHGQTSGCSGTNGIACRLNETIEFYASSFGYSFQACDRFEWNFGDGTALSSDRDPTHVFPGSATAYDVKMRVYNTTNTAGATVTQRVSFESSVPVKPIPVLSYSGFPARGTKGKAVTFTAMSDMDTTTGWSWTFGDGTPADNSQSTAVGRTNTITHTFANTGTFTVRVEARNSEDAATAPKGIVFNSITIDETPEYSYLLPVVVHAGGQNNSVWRTDVQIYNPDPNASAANPLKLTAQFKGTQKTLEIPNSTQIYENFMTQLVNGDEQGPVIMTARTEHAPQIWTRTYNQTDGGTFGQFIPAIRLDVGGGGALGQGKYYLAGLRQDARFRTNLGFVNPTSQPITAQVAVYDDNRFQVGQFTLTLQPFQLDQFPVTHPKAVPALSPDRPFTLEIDVPSGQWLVAYASYIDSASNDPVFIQAVRDSELSHEDYRYSVIPGVGHVGDWRSDVTIFNPAAQTIAVDLAYHDQSGVKVAGAQNVVIRSGEFVQYADLLKQGVLGEVADSLGVLRVTVPGTLLTSRFPMTFARTYNDNGSGRTYGQGIPGFAIDRANVKPGKPALVPGVRSNENYYTNVGLTNVSNVEVVATVFALDHVTGTSTAIQQHTLEPYQSIIGRVDLGGKQTGSLKIEVTGGNVWAFASIVDDRTKDPEYVPATPLVP